MSPTPNRCTTNSNIMVNSRFKGWAGGLQKTACMVQLIWTRSSATAQKQRVCCKCLSKLANWSCNAQNTAESQMYNKRLSTPCLEKLCQLIFCSFSVKYEPISIKIGRIVPEQTLNKTVPKLSTSPKVCACTTLGNLKCPIEPSTQ